MKYIYIYIQKLAGIFYICTQSLSVHIRPNCAIVDQDNFPDKGPSPQPVIRKIC